MSNSPIKRNRNVAHSWCDKRINRFFRHWSMGKYTNEIPEVLSKNDFKHISLIYMALCEIDSDFTEARNNPNKVITSLLNTVSTYAGVHRNTTCTYMQILRDLGLIDYGKKYNSKHECIGSFLEMYEFDKDDIIKKAAMVLQTHSTFGRTIVQAYDIKNSNKLLEKNIKENTLSVTEENSDYVLLANQLSRIVRRHYPKDILTDKKINDWVAPIKKIFKDWSGSPDELKEWLKLYYIHHDPKNRYHPVIRSGKGLLERIKGGQLERFVNTINQPVKQYSNKSKGVSDHILHPSDFKPSDNSYDDILKDKTIRYTNS